MEHPRSGLTAARGSGMPTMRLRPPVDYRRYERCSRRIAGLSDKGSNGTSRWTVESPNCNQPRRSRIGSNAWWVILAIGQRSHVDEVVHVQLVNDAT